MALKVTEEELEWSNENETYSVRQIQELVGLPVLVYVREGIYDSVESGTFSGRDYMKLHGCENLEKVVAYPTLSTDGKISENYKNWNKPLEIPLDFRIMAKVIPKQRDMHIYPVVRLLIDDFPRFVQPGRNISGLNKNRSIVLVPEGSTLELLRTTVSGAVQRLVCSYRDQEISFPMDCPGNFSIVPDTNAYTIREIVNRLALPQIISLDDSGVDVTTYFSREAKGALAKLKKFMGNFVLDKVVHEKVVYGTHRLDCENSHKNNIASIGRQPIVVISLDSDATFQVALNRESSTYTTVFTENYIKTIKTSELVPTFIEVQGERDRTIQNPVDNGQGEELRSSIKPQVNPKPQVKEKPKLSKQPKQGGRTDGADGDGHYKNVMYLNVEPPKDPLQTQSDGRTKTSKCDSVYEFLAPGMLTAYKPPPVPEKIPKNSIDVPEPMAEQTKTIGRADFIDLPKPKIKPTKTIRWAETIDLPKAGVKPTQAIRRAYSIDLPKPIAKPTKTERAQEAVQKFLKMPRDGAIHVKKLLKGAKKSSPKDKQGTPVSSPVDEDSPTPFTEVELSESSDDDDNYYEDICKFKFTVPRQTDDDIYAETDLSKNLLGQRKLPNIPNLPTGNTIISTTQKSQTPKAYVKPMKPMKTDATDVDNRAKAVQPAKLDPPIKALQPTKAFQPRKEIQSPRLSPVRKPDLPTTKEVQKQAPPAKAPKPVISQTFGANVATTKVNSVSREEMKNLSMEELLEWLKKLGLGEKANTFYAKNVDGDLFLKMDKDTFKSEYKLTGTEILNVERFQNEGIIPKSSYA